MCPVGWEIKHYRVLLCVCVCVCGGGGHDHFWWGGTWGVNPEIRPFGGPHTPYPLTPTGETLLPPSLFGNPERTELFLVSGFLRTFWLISITLVDRRQSAKRWNPAKSVKMKTRKSFHRKLDIFCDVGDGGLCTSYRKSNISYELRVNRAHFVWITTPLFWKHKYGIFNFVCVC